MRTLAPVSECTRNAARGALRRAFAEATRMPGTLLPLELLAELTGAARRIAAEVEALGEQPVSLLDGAGPEDYTVEHSIDATIVGLLIGRRLVPEAQLEELAMALFLQDIGKLALPPRLVRKPGPLEPDEWELMMQHPLLGLEFLRDDAIGWRAKSVVAAHHERWDGSGYPSGLAGHDISLFARIAAVADVFDAVTSERWHAPASPQSVGVETVRAGAGLDFDPHVVDAFLEAVHDAEPVAV